MEQKRSITRDFRLEETISVKREISTTFRPQMSSSLFLSGRSLNKLSKPRKKSEGSQCTFALQLEQRDAYMEILERLKIEFEEKWANPVSNTAKLEDFHLCRTLGAGSYGRVILVKENRTDVIRYYAMKMLSKEQVVKSKQVDHTKNEKKILQAIEFPSLIKLYYSFQDPTNLYLVLSYEPGGELFNNLRRVRRFPETTSKFVAAQVVMGFEYLHEMNVIYRDLKPENLMISDNGYIKITDFGFAKRLNSDARTYTLCGTPEYLAPEIIKHKGYSRSVDWWTLGVLMFELSSGNVPFVAKDHTEMYSKIVKGHFKCPDFFTDELVEAVQGILAVDVSQRYGCLQGGVIDIKTLDWYSDIDWFGLYNQTVHAPFSINLKGPGDASNFPVPKVEEPVHISAKDRYPGIFDDF